MEIAKPQKLTDEVRAKIEEAFALDCTFEEASLLANVSPRSIYNWMESDPEWKERLQKLRETPVLAARRSVVGALKQPDMAFRYLERKKKGEFAQRVENDHSGEVKIQVTKYDDDKDSAQLRPGDATVSVANLEEPLALQEPHYPPEGG